MGERARARKGLGDRRVLVVALDIEVEAVLPGPPGQGAGLNRTEIHARLGEGTEESVQRSGLGLLHGVDSEREIVSTRRGRLATDHEKPRHVAALILDRVRHGAQTKAFASTRRGHRCNARVLGGKGGRSRGAGAFLLRHVRQMLLQPASTLCERLRMRLHHPNVLAAPALVQERVFDFE